MHVKFRKQHFPRIRTLPRGLLPQPSIWALPGAVIPQDSSVTIYCKGPPGMLRWQLLREGLVITWYDRISQGVQGLSMFFIQPVTYINAGTYYCGYWKEGVWSGLSDPLDLVVTGVYKDTPSLTALPGPNVTLGGNVTLLCQASQYYHVFNLSKDGRNASPQDFLRQDHKNFLISPVTLAHGGTYRCYGSSKSFPHRWSLPSNPVKLLVTDPSAPENGYLPIVIGILAIVVLLLLSLLFLIFRCWHQVKHGNTDGETKNQVKCKSTNSVMDFQEENQYDVLQDIQPEKDRQMDIQAPIEEDPQEVTYAQLHQETLRGSVDTQFSHTHKDSSDQRCVYATLTLS
ncbi:leukocyte immunoglobulin-like receptor subfamily B member 3 isoform X2 [Halichoerus grypus]|uniref:leukocyte immunoglobulin-like receptor subfamily B member 4 isoform X2 n=1 Tax=Halichoerus grypus TaxID=9711 RepID=UPI00165A01C8|nr:leukocyte immunoglobulin-like receptor subfamily B member 4 isoform X2 [Halichoerus grypus]XP_035947983.1 leukocyte immunoglobulin-like receptor subfamily B member 4 isoform X2 [Halichoerus grypus]